MYVKQSTKISVLIQLQETGKLPVLLLLQLFCKPLQIIYLKIDIPNEKGAVLCTAVCSMVLTPGMTMW